MMKTFKVNGNTYWMSQEMVDIEKKFYDSREELLRRTGFGSIPATTELLKEVYEKYGLEYTPPVSRVGRYVMTDRGMMYTHSDRFFELLSSPDDISEVPYEGEVNITREVSSFDF